MIEGAGESELANSLGFSDSPADWTLYNRYVTANMTSLAVTVSIDVYGYGRSSMVTLMKYHLNKSLPHQPQESPLYLRMVVPLITGLQRKVGSIEMTQVGIHMI